MVEVLPPAYVLDMDANGLGIARTLGRRGIHVVGLDHRSWLPGLRSRFVRPVMCADIVKDPDAVLETLMAEGDELDGRAVLFPASDAAVLFISRNRAHLSEHFDFMVPTEKVQEAMINKRLQYNEAVRIGIPMTETFYPRSPDDLDEIVDTIRFPAFIKPLYSHIWYRTFGNKGFVVKDSKELHENMAKVFATDLEVMVQEIIWPPGKGLFNLAAYFGRDGYVSKPFTWQKIRQFPPNFGVGSLLKSVHQPEVAKLGLKFMKGIDYRGIGSVGFKMDERDNKWKLIELNARTWMQNELSDGAGIPLTYLEYLDLTGRPKPEIKDFRDGVRWWNGMSDMDSFRRLRRRGEMTFVQWVRSWYGSDICAYYARDDLWPVAKRLGYGIDLAKLIVQLIKMRTDEDAVPVMNDLTAVGTSNDVAPADPTMVVGVRKEERGF